MKQHRSVWFEGIKWAEQNIHDKNFNDLDHMLDSWVAPIEFKEGIADYVEYYHSVLVRKA
jgi:hypothetical protein